ncbi:glycosyltransferase [Priestia aryabhattai]|uniref:glycosyltransferase n=1 Tax=Priestia aryabhattai TaxID=412384 RepID=UPI001CFED9F0|nr:glycosyltransferase [Priestia aryabhattai]
MMRKNVCMFVWNHFTNDARVLRECTALSKNGYSVDLICIHDPKNSDLKQYEEVNEHFHVHRVKRYPSSLLFMKKAYRALLKYKVLALIAFLLWLGAAYIAPYVVLPVTIVAALLLKTKLQVVWVRGSIILRMILKGRKKKYDIYHSNDLNTLPQGFICAKLRFKRQYLVYDSHEVQTSRTGYDSGVYAKMEAFFINKIDSMIVENHTRAKYNEDLYGFYPNVVYNYPFQPKKRHQETIDLHERLGLPENEKILLYQGGIQTGRGLEKLVQAAPLFKEGTLVFIGDGRIKPELERMVAEMKLEDKVKFIPKVPLQDLPKYTKNAYLGFQVLNNVCFNHYSASSNKLFEYIMSDVPVVACDFPEIKKVVEGEHIGLCVDSHNYEEIASAVNQLLRDPVLRATMSNNCKTAKFKYNWENEQLQFLKVYQAI